MFNASATVMTSAFGKPTKVVFDVDAPHRGYSPRSAIGTHLLHIGRASFSPGSRTARVIVPRRFVPAASQTGESRGPSRSPEDPSAQTFGRALRRGSTIESRRPPIRRVPDRCECRDSVADGRVRLPSQDDGRSRASRDPPTEWNLSIRSGSGLTCCRRISRAFEPKVSETSNEASRVGEGLWFPRWWHWRVFQPMLTGDGLSEQTSTRPRDPKYSLPSGGAFCVRTQNNLASSGGSPEELLLWVQGDARAGEGDAK